ncbi:O-antigen ligase family protein [Halobacillus litoralis]|uniref:O-antigen ligase family protein n=1 Tax=Halobacillus litoralis TaxID=45668 RepID=UPI00136F7098|nr:O-antigen ligase family protein [Halobacillus litoralis]MYL36417.1 hypothetical protein [Halobacillus litoralis]
MKNLIFVLCVISIILKILFNGVGFGGVSFWFYTVFLSGYCIFIFLSMHRKLGLNGRIKSLLVSLFIFLTYIILVFTANNLLFDIPYVMGLVMILIFIVSLYVSIDSFKKIKIMINTIIICTFISALIAIGQYFDIGVVRSIHNMILVNKETSFNSSRVSGMSPTVISFSYELIIGITLLIYRTLTFNNNSVFKFVDIIFLLTMLLALVFNQTRSSLLVMLVCIFLILIKGNKTKIRTVHLFNILIFFIGIGISLFILINYLDINNRFNSDTASASSRIPMLITAFNYSLENPFGTGVYTPNITHIPSNTQDSVISIILSNTPHNFLINLLVYYGYIGLLIALFIMVFVWKSHKRNVRSGLINPELKRLSYCLTIIVFGFSLNGMTHNMGLFSIDIVIWTIITMIFTISKFKICSKK